MAMIGLRYDLRAPSWGSATHPELYAACLDQARWGDERGIDFVVLSEHHGADDGYIPAPVTMAGVIAGHTRRIGINIAAILVPLHDPVRLAEELAGLHPRRGGGGGLCSPGGRPPRGWRGGGGGTGGRGGG